MINPSAQQRWGRAAHLDFDNPDKWVTVKGVPLLDEHVMTNEKGKPVARVDRAALEEIARNNNRRVHQTGDPSTIILGHTSDDESVPEKPARGFTVNYRVKPFRRDKSGRVLYAIHGDFKIRPRHAHIIEDYPRRSVELWWTKKELDPIALLGGSSPERDLSVLIRNARLNHVQLRNRPGQNGTREHDAEFDLSAPIKFSSRGNFTIETYSIEDMIRYGAAAKGKGKVKKVMGEFERGELRSGSKSGPKVASKKQAVAIAMSEAGMSRRNAGGGKKTAPKRNAREECDDMEDEGDDGPDRYTDDLMRTGEMGPDGLEHADDQVDDGEFDDPGRAAEMDDAEADGMDDENDPVLAKVMQSKWAKGLDAKLTMILQALEGAGAGGQPGAEGMPGGDDMGAEEMGAPGSGAAPPPGAGDPNAMPMEGDEDPEAETQVAHGKKPVKMSGSAMTGPMNTTIPEFGQERRKMSRQTQRRAGGGDPEVFRLKRQLHDMRVKNARSEAQTRVTALEQEGVLFGDTAQAHADGKAETTDYLASLLLQEGGDEDADYEEGIIRTRYKRRKADPANPTQVGLARYARKPAGTDGPAPDEELSDDEFDQLLTDDVQVMQYANLQTGPRRMSRKDAQKYMRKQLGLK